MISKIPLYNILNMLLIGFVFIGVNAAIFYNEIGSLMGSVNIDINNIGFEAMISTCLLAVVYEVGLVVNRFGSIVVEGAFKRFKLIPFNNDYKKFNDLKVKYPILGTLSMEYALSRNSVGLFLLLTMSSFIKRNVVLGLVLLLICLLFYFSARKHSSKIVDLMSES